MYEVYNWNRHFIMKVPLHLLKMELLKSLKKESFTELKEQTHFHHCALLFKINIL